MSYIKLASGTFEFISATAGRAKLLVGLIINCRYFKFKKQTILFKNAVIFLVFTFSSGVAFADCRIPAPHAAAFSNLGGSCPNGYYPSGSACAPSSSAKYAFANPGGGGCPNGYYPSGNACVASSDNSCNAFYSSGGSCPNGYYPSGKSCVAN